MKDNLKMGLAAAGLAVLSLVLGVMYAILTTPSSDQPAVSVPAATVSAPGTTAPAPAPHTLSISEAGSLLVKDGVGLSPLLGEWLMVDDLIRRIASALSFLGHGKIPKASLDFLVPETRFRSRIRRERFYMHPKGYARYDTTTYVVYSIDEGAAVSLFKRIAPALKAACGEMGLDNCDAEKNIKDTIALLLATPEVEGDIELRPKTYSYVFVDESLEALAPIQKLLLRTGPDNGKKVRTKLGELQSLL